LKENLFTFAFDYHDWWCHPLSCMDVLYNYLFVAICFGGALLVRDR